MLSVSLDLVHLTKRLLPEKKKYCDAFFFVVLRCKKNDENARFLYYPRKNVFAKTVDHRGF